MVEHPICNRQVEGSTPFSSNFLWGRRIAAIARDCKSLDLGLRWFESSRPHSHREKIRKSLSQNHK